LPKEIGDDDSLKSKSRDVDLEILWAFYSDLPSTDPPPYIPQSCHPASVCAMVYAPLISKSGNFVVDFGKLMEVETVV
jgi:hypothetical protein